MDRNKYVFRFQIDPEQLLAFKKLLWEKGLQPQQFFSYIVHCVNLYDSRLEPFYEEAVQDKRNKLEEKGEESVDADTLYKMIQDGLIKPNE